MSNNWRCSFFVTKFTSEDKMNAVIHYQNGSESIKDIAQSLGANHEVVRMWIKQFEYHGNPGL